LLAIEDARSEAILKQDLETLREIYAAGFHAVTSHSASLALH
jgi:hypothetical protein